MRKTSDIFKTITETKGIIHATMGTIKNRNCIGLIEAENINKSWQEYTEEPDKKDLNDPVNCKGMITHLEPDILECESKCHLRSHHYKQS